MRQPWTSLTRSGLAAAFGAAARLRHGRPLHASGLVLDAHLRLHGTPERWGVPFLDQRMDLPGIARLSRSVGVPPPFPDILGLALRWDQDDTSADLLLATTGRTALGRRLLRPATRWTGLYSSLFPYQAGERRVLLGALLHTPERLPATLDALAQVVEHGPLTAALLAAAPSGPWRPFGQVRLSAPVLTDADLPTRFNPLRHPIAGLPPASWLNDVRDAAYASAQQVPDLPAEARDLSGVA
ncbi:hypothetical protein ABZ907_42430 [Nonomuraea wenchangensis]